MKQKISFKPQKGWKRINFPVQGVQDFREEIQKVLKKYKLPKHSSIGFLVRYYYGDKNYGGFTVTEVFIEK